MKQTAVEWLVENVEDFFGGLIAPSIIEQAKEMEKQQIIDAFLAGYLKGYLMPMDDVNSEQYYNETFKSE